MERRKYLTTIGAITTTTVVGCVGNDDPVQPEDENEDTPEEDTDESQEEADGSAEFGTPADPQPSFETSDVNVDEPVTTLDVELNGGAFTELVDGEQFWEPEAGEVFLLLQIRITNTGDESVEFAGGNVIAVDDAGNEAEWTVLIDGSRLNVEILPGEEFNEWIVLVADSGAEAFDISVQPFGDIQTESSWNENVEITFPQV